MMLDKFQSWLYKNHPRLLDYWFQFTLMEWVVLLTMAVYIILMVA